MGFIMTFLYTYIMCFDHIPPLPSLTLIWSYWKKNKMLSKENSGSKTSELKEHLVDHNSWNT
jgi:hypothetical protein